MCIQVATTAAAKNSKQHSHQRHSNFVNLGLDSAQLHYIVAVIDSTSGSTSAELHYGVAIFASKEWHLIRRVALQSSQLC